MIPTEKPGTPEELLHYGVKGMKWGVRRDLRRERRAQKFVRKSADIQRQINAGGSAKKVTKLRKQQAQADKDAEAKRQGKLSRRQKRVLAGGVAVGAIVATTAVLMAVDSGAAREIINRGKEIVEGEKFEFKKDSRLAERNLTPKAINDVIASPVNPGYYRGAEGSYNNCRRATLTYEMRRRGHDVTATRSILGSGQHALGMTNVLDPKDNTTSGGHLLNVLLGRRKNTTVDQVVKFNQRGGIHKFDSPDLIFARLAQEPNRSRGEIETRWAMGSGHSMAYEIINGLPHIFDAQNNAHYISIEELQEHVPVMSRAGFTRLDDKDLDLKFLQRWVKNND